MRPSSELSDYLDFSDYLDYNSEYIREQFQKRGRVHDDYLGGIREVLVKDGERDLANFFSYHRTEGYEGGCEAVDRLGLNSDHAKLLKDILKFLENNQAEYRKALGIPPPRQASVPSSLPPSAPVTASDGAAERPVEPVQAFESRCVRAVPLATGAASTSSRVLELEKTELQERIKVLEKERNDLGARCAGLQNRADELKGVSEERLSEIGRLKHERDGLLDACEGLRTQMARAGGVWDVLSGASMGLPPDRVSRVVKEFGSDNLRDGADHAVLLALLVTVCRAEVEDNRFLERFVFLEGEIETACAGDASRRDRLRGIVGPILAGRLSHWRIDWAFAGKSFDSRFCVPVSDSGTRIVEVLTAALWRDGDCVRKARVRTI